MFHSDVKVASRARTKLTMFCDGNGIINVISAKNHYLMFRANKLLFFFCINFDNNEFMVTKNIRFALETAQQTKYTLNALNV